MKKFICIQKLGQSNVSHQKSSSLIPAFGIVFESNGSVDVKNIELNSNTTYEPLVMWIIRGTNNTKEVNSFIRGESKFGVYSKEVMNVNSIGSTSNTGGRDINYDKKLCDIHTFGNLSLQESSLLINYNATQEVYSNTFKVGSLIFIPEGMSDGNEYDYILTQLSTIFKERYPVPMKKEWEDQVFKRLIGELVTLNTVGTIPFKKVLKIEFKQELFKEIIVEEFAKWQFNEKFKFVPKVTSLLYYLDVDTFKPKKWQLFLEGIGGKDFFDKKEKKNQIDYVYVFECFQEDAIELIDILSNFYLENKEKGEINLSNLDFYKIAKALMRETFFNSKKAISAIRKLLNYMSEHDKISNINLNSTLIFKKILTVITNEEFFELSCNSPKRFFEEIINISYKEIDPRCSVLALKASDLLLSYETYLKYEKAYLDNIKYIKEDPRFFPTISGEIENSAYTWECIDMEDPNAWFVGLETNCCQHLENAGASCVRYMANNPGKSGIFRVMKKGRTVAQSFMWVDIEKNTMVFDNIEVLGGEIRDVILECYNSYCQKVLEMKICRFYKFTIGLGCNSVTELNSYALEKPLGMSKISLLKDVRKLEEVYSDANRSQIIFKRI